jgi:hypothetical protein
LRHGLIPSAILSLLRKCVLEPVQSICLLEPLTLCGVERYPPIEVCQGPAGVGDPPLLPVRLPLADGEHFLEGFPGRGPVLAILLQPGAESQRVNHVLVQLALHVASDGELLHG